MFEEIFFDLLHVYKKHYLVLENIRGKNSVTSCILPYIDQIKNTQTVDALISIIESLIKAIANTIAEEGCQNMTEYNDYTLYTNKYHYRKYWNEIENDDVIDEALLKFCSLVNIEGCLDDTDEYFYEVRLYDLNDYPMYFDTLYSLKKFIKEYRIQCFDTFVYNGSECVEIMGLKGYEEK